MARHSRNSARAALTLLVVLLAGAPASAHRLDEYLQAARIAIEPAAVRVELDLTPGVAVANSVLAELDRDRDGAVSSAEAKAYVDRVAGALSLEIDGKPLVLSVTGRTVPSVAAIRAGEGTLGIQFAASLAGVGSGPHQLSFRNSHRPDVSVYLANALVPPSDRVAVTNQRRDYNQRRLDVDYVLREERPGTWWLAGVGAALLAAIAFIVQQKGTL
jgi:hypothetical protein